MSTDESDYPSACSSPLEQYVHIFPPTQLWKNDPVFGIVHPAGCKTCQHYISHIVTASHSGDISFQLAVKERDGKSTMRFLDGIRAGRRFQRDHDKDKVARYRAERDDAVNLGERYRAEIRGLYEELSHAKDKLLALQFSLEDFSPFQVEESLSFESDHDEADIPEHALRVMQFQNMLLASSPATPSEIPIEAEDLPSIGPMSLVRVGPEEGIKLTSSPESENELGHSLPTIDPPSLANPSDSSIAWNQLIDLSDSNSADAEPYIEDSVDSDSSTSVSTGCSPPLGISTDAQVSPEVDLERIKYLITAAQAPGNVKQLMEIRALCSLAHQTPRSLRTALQKYVLIHWKGTNPAKRPSPPQTATPSAIRSTAPPPIFVDASHTGIGFVMGGRWLAWTLKEGWKGDGRDINWGEMVAVELGLRAIITAGYRSTRVVVRSDNAGVVQALNKRSSKHIQQKSILREILSVCEAYNIEIEPRWISTEENPADNPSRGSFAPRALLFPSPPHLPSHLVPFVQQAFI